MELVLVILLAYLLICFWFIWYQMKKPILMPFGLYKYLCSCGYKAPITELPPEMDGLSKFAFVDIDYRKWFAEINQRGKVTRLEFFALNVQRLNEINAELERRGLK